MYNFPDIASLSRHLAGASLKNQQPASTAGAHEAIAIVGVGLRFPGADTPQEYWEQLLRGADLVEELPTTRWADESVSIGDKGSPGQLASASAGFIRGVDEFDAEFFGISPREAVDLDPQQRVLLEGGPGLLQHGQLQLQRQQLAAQLVRAWDVLEAEALANGHQPVGPHAYCIEIASGHIVCLALHDAMGIRQAHPEWTVYDMVDAAVVLANNFSSDFIEKTLQSFPEAKVTRVIGTANDTFNVDLGDEIPF